MAYGTRFSHDRFDECVKEAHRRAIRHHDVSKVAPLGFLYRFEDHSYASRIDPYDDSDDNWTSTTYLELKAIPIRSVTPFGWTINANNGLGWRFISRNTTKQYALPDVGQALQSFIARKTKQANIYQAKADKARRMIEIAQGKGTFR